MMLNRIVHKNDDFELREEYTKERNSKKRRRFYRIRKLGYCSTADVQRINQIIDPRNNTGRTSIKRFRNRVRAQQAFMLLALGW